MENRDNQNPNPAQGSRKSLAYIAEHVPLQQGQKYRNLGLTASIFIFWELSASA